MRTRHAVAFVALLGGVVVALSASGQSGIYAVIERVTFEPTAGPPDRIQLWGAFAIMERSTQGFTGYVFRGPTRGYLYLSLPVDSVDAANARREWKDLASVAGTKQAVAFGYWDQYRGEMMPSLRPADAKPVNPDIYRTNVGLTKLNAGHGGVVDDLLKLIERR